MLGWFSLEHRRLRDDLMDIYNVRRGINRIANRIGVFLTRQGSAELKGTFKVRGRNLRDLRGGVRFAERVIVICNDLQEMVVVAKTTKRNLDMFKTGRQRKLGSNIGK